VRLIYAPSLPLRLTLRGRNLLDEPYATPGGFEHLQPAIQQDGRSWQAGIEWRF